MNTFEQYMVKMSFSKETRNSYRCIIDKFLLDNPSANTYNYQDILNYMEFISKQQLSRNTKQTRLTAIKKYYYYLIEEGIREDHPCMTLNIKGATKKGVIFSDLFSMAELESLMEREERYQHLKLMHQVIISLLIYQALSSSEIISLKLSHVDMDAGTIYIRGGREFTSRHLEIHPKQYRLFDRYLDEARKRLLYKDKENDYFILNYQGKNYTASDGIGYLIETLKTYFPDRNLTAKSIRDSVIAYWLNVRKIPLEQVQLLAGHRWISSTLRYRQASINEQREILNKFHPLG
jgi:integrase/recombinase XerD